MVSERESQFVTEDALAGPIFFSLFVVARALATHFTLNDFAFAGNGCSQFFRKIEIAADTIAMDTIEAEKGFPVGEINFVLHSAVPGGTSGIKVIHSDLKRFQARKFLG